MMTPPLWRQREAGEYTEQVDVCNAASGVYFVRLQAGAESVTLPVSFVW